MQTTEASSFAARLFGWESVWNAYVSDKTTARWDAMDAWCSAHGESNPIPAPAAFLFHAKPVGGGPCPICGCDAKRLRATHRATTSRERAAGRSDFIKRVKVCFGTDTDERAV